MDREIKEIKIDKPWIEIRTGLNNNIIAFDDFVKNLEEIGSVHLRKVWLPAACTGLEIWIVIKWGLGTLGSIWLTGKIYDILKVYEKKLINYLESLFDSNIDNQNDELIINNLDIEYDDITIRINWIDKAHLTHLSCLFNNLSKHLRILKSNGINNINKIVFPICGEELGNFVDSNIHYREVEDLEFRLWSITYDYGLSKIYYDSVGRTIFNL